jgi:hypothetical protein
VGTPWEYLNEIPAAFVQQGVHDFVDALFSSRALRRQGYIKGFTIKPKVRDGNYDTLMFTKSFWNKGRPYHTYFNHFFEFKEWVTPTVHILLSLTFSIRRLPMIAD